MGPLWSDTIFLCELKRLFRTWLSRSSWFLDFINDLYSWALFCLNSWDKNLPLEVAFCRCHCNDALKVWFETFVWKDGSHRRSALYSIFDNGILKQWHCASFDFIDYVLALMNISNHLFVTQSLSTFAGLLVIFLVLFGHSNRCWMSVSSCHERVICQSISPRGTWRLSLREEIGDIIPLRPNAFAVNHLIPSVDRPLSNYAVLADTIFEILLYLNGIVFQMRSLEYCAWELLMSLIARATSRFLCRHWEENLPGGRQDHGLCKFL